MKAEAYTYAEGDGPIPYELVLRGYIREFGAEAVMGRPALSAGEIRRMIVAENVVNAYRSRKASQDWGKWAAENPAMDELLKSIEAHA